MWIIHAKLPPEVGALVVKAIAAVANPLQQEKQEKLQNDEKDVSAETFSDAVQKEEANRYAELLQHTRADALVKIAEHFLASAGEKLELQGLKGSERCQIVLHVDVNTLRQHDRTGNPAHEHCHLDHKHWISPKTAKRLSPQT
jgi:hypothetical protein